jgi:hypothetical protein
LRKDHDGLGDDVEDAFVYGLKEDVDDERDSDPKKLEENNPSFRSESRDSRTFKFQVNRNDDNLKVKNK